MPGGIFGVLWGDLVTTAIWILGTLWAWITGLVGSLASSLWGWVTTAFWGIVGWGSTWLSAIFGVVLGWGLVLLLIGTAVLLNAIGVEDVHSTIFRRIAGKDGTQRQSIEAVQDVNPAAVTDTEGRFSSASFERATGLTPAEFIHLFIRSKGGHVRQQTLNSCLPWSKATVSRLLTRLEEEGVIERVRLGRENVVRLAEHETDRHD